MEVEENPQIGRGLVEGFGTGEVEVGEKAGTGWTLEMEKRGGICEMLEVVVVKDGTG